MAFGCYGKYWGQRCFPCELYKEVGGVTFITQLGTAIMVYIMSVKIILSPKRQYLLSNIM